MIFSVVSIFPELVTQWFQQGIISRALATDIVQIKTWNPRDYTQNKYKRIDDRPFGGGPGMVMQYEPLANTAQAVNNLSPKCTTHIYLSPQGVPFNQSLAESLSKQEHIALWCGRYEGIDQRFIDEHIDFEISIGDFVLSGGEIAASIVIDAVSRFIPNVLGDKDSAQEDSFQNHLLDHPHYTRPEIVGIIPAPEILLSGNHALIAQWRLKQALGRTFLQRPDLINRLTLTNEQMSLLAEFLQEYKIGEP